jgi:hypothetical protein
VATLTAPLVREEEILTQALDQIRSRLPTGWRLEPADAPDVRRRLDAVVRLISPQRQEVSFVVEVKRSLVTRDLPAVLDQLTGAIATEFPAGQRTPGALPLVVSRYLPAPLQTWLTDRNIAYADATGNLRLALDRPALFLRDLGATKDPWRGPGRPKGNLTGEPAARVVRALLDYTPPYSVPRLVELSGASNGPTYRVVEFLEDQALLERAPRGPIEQVHWPELLRRWSADYGFLRTNPVAAYLAPRGLPAVMSALADTDADQTRYAVTGSVAAQNWAAYAPARAAMIYCDNPSALADRLDLRPVDNGANVLLATAAYDVVYDRARLIDGVAVAAPSQVAVDLMTGSGRNPAEAEALLEWMQTHVESWRQ